MALVPSAAPSAPIPSGKSAEAMIGANSAPTGILRLHHH
jgi:hypothetical protein